MKSRVCLIARLLRAAPLRSWIASAAWALALVFVGSACRTAPRTSEPLPVAEPIATSAEPVESVPPWIGEPLSWSKLAEIEAWLATQSPSTKGYWQVEGELQLNLGRLEFAARERTSEKTTPAAIQSRLRAARAGFVRVVAEPEASPSQQRRAKDAIAKVDKSLGVKPKSAPFGIPVIARATWGAMPARPEHMDRNKGGWKRITVHHSADRDPPRLDGSLAASAAAVRSIQKAHIDGKETHYSDIGYHFVIDPYGKVFQGRELQWQGAHAYGDNNIQNLGVCLIGNFEEERPTEAALASLREMLDELRSTNKIPRSAVFTHHDLKNTECPGKYLAAWVEKYKKES